MPLPKVYLSGWTPAPQVLPQKILNDTNTFKEQIRNQVLSSNVVMYNLIYRFIFKNLLFLQPVFMEPDFTDIVTLKDMINFNNLFINL